MYGETGKLLNTNESNAIYMNWTDVFSQGNFSIIDFETSGLSEKLDYIIEVGLLEIRDDIPSTPISWTVNPLFPAPFHLTDEITTITGITETEISFGADPKELFPSFIDRIRWFPCWGHNICRFDALFIDEECRRACTIPPPKSTWFDTAAIFKAWQLSLTGKPWTREPYILDEIEDYDTFYDYGMMILEKRIRGLKYNLPFCCETLNIDTSDITFHRAGADVSATYRVREALKKIILHR